MKNALSYWKRYDLVFKRFSFKAIYQKIMDITNKLEEPFAKTTNKGRKYKINPREYASYISFETITHNSPYRDMELASELYISKHIDHSTFHKNFLKIPYEYLCRLLQSIAQMLEKLLGYCAATIFDSTGLSTRIYEEAIDKGRIIIRNKDYKLHTLLAYHPKERITYYIDALSSDKHVSDAEGATQLLKRNNTHGYHLGDRGYDAEKVYREILDKEHIPIIKPKKNKAKLFSSKIKGRSMYKEHIYKELRGIIETSYGGLENKGSVDTRCIRDDCIKKKGILAAARHNLMTYFRASVNVDYLSVLIDKLN